MSSATHMALPAHVVAPNNNNSNNNNNNNNNNVGLPLGKRGHKRSVSLETNAPLPLPLRSTPILCGAAQSQSLSQASPLLLPCYTGTLKSRNEQRRLSQKYGSHNNLDDDYGATLPTMSMSMTMSMAPQTRSKFQNIRQMFELSRSCVAAAAGGKEEEQQREGPEEALQSLPATLTQQPPVRRSTPIAMAGNHGNVAMRASSLTISEQQKHQQQQQQQQQQPQLPNAGEPMEQSNGGGSFLRPIAFKPIPFEPDYRIQQAPQQPHSHSHSHPHPHPNPHPHPHGHGHAHGHCELAVDHRYGYGSTPSLAPAPAATLKFGSTTDLRLGSVNGGASASSSSSAAALCSPGQAALGLAYSAYGNSLAARRRGYRATMRSSSNDDSLDSIGHVQEGVNGKCSATTGNSNNNNNNNSNGSINNNNKYHCELTPSPSDSGISDLEAALKDRDSELSYLRQTMEHNEKVIFRVQKDKEVCWEHETQRLKLYYENQQREYLLKFKKMEQLLALQQFQLKQHKLRQTEQLHKLRDQLAALQQELMLVRSNNKSLKQAELQLRDSAACLSQQLDEAHQTLGGLRTQLEDSEWKVCERNGEIALLKTQLKEAHLEINMKDHAILNLKHNSNNNNNNNNNSHNNCDHNKPSYQSQPKPNAENGAQQQQQLHKIISLKDQVIGALTNELAKLRKELSDLAIAHEYGEEPCGRYTRLKQQLDNLNEICQKTRKYTQVAMSTPTPTATPMATPTPVAVDAIMQRLQLAHNLDQDEPSQQTLDTLIEESTTYAEDIAKLRQKLDDFRINLELEKRQWCAEKDKVLSYQKQLQAHYIHMYQKLRCLDNAGSATGASNTLTTARETANVS